MADDADRADERRFAQVVFSRATPVTWALIAANVAVYVAMAYSAQDLGPASDAYQVALVNFGAKLNQLIDQGEYWRLVTPVFIHIGLIHLFVNMYSLSVIGPLIEQLYGSSRYLVMYLLSGVVGVLGSYYFSTGTLSAGASGALFGLLGVLFVFGLKYRNELPGAFRHTFSPMRLVPVLGLNLIITFALPFIDKWGHLGGLAAGAVLGAVVGYARAGERWPGLFWWAAAACSALAVVGSFALAYQAPHRTLSEVAEIVGGPGGALGRPGAQAVNRSLVDPYNETNEALAEAVRALVALDGAPAGRPAAPGAGAKARAAAAIARQASGVDDRSRALFVRQADLLERVADLLERQGPPPTERELGAVRDEFGALQRDWNGWLESEAEKHGITLKNENSTSGGI